MYVLYDVGGLLGQFWTPIVQCFTTEDAVRIISYAVTRLHNYNPYTFVTTITYYTLIHLHWLTSQLSITVSNYHTLPMSVSYRDLTRRTALVELLPKN
jgi:hypothetical protein